MTKQVIILRALTEVGFKELREHYESEYPEFTFLILKPDTEFVRIL